jgi:ABC-2 type transport system ATP-binding protein
MMTSESSPGVADRALAGPQSVIAVDDLVIRYGEKRAVNGVSFSLQRGRVLALLGPNGAGKTSIVEACEGYRSVASGRVRVLGLDPRRQHDTLMPRLGIMLQSGGVYPAVTAVDVLTLFAAFASDPLDVDDLVRRLGLTGFRRTPFSRLSGGERQRLSLALAVVGRPEVVFLDEPTAGMDTRTRHDTWQLIRELRDDGVSVLLTTHLLDEAEQLADDVVIIADGRVIAEGSPAELTAAKGVDGLTVHAQPGLPLPALRAALPAGVSAQEETPGSYHVAGGINARELAAVASWCVQVGACITDLSTHRRTLEDVFLRLTARAEDR